MDIQDRVFRLAFAPLTRVIVAEEYVFAHIPEAELRTLLVCFSLYFRVAYLLNVVLRYLDSGFTDRQELMYHLDCLEMRLDFVLYRRSKPTIRFPSVEKSLLTVSRFSAPSLLTKLTARCKQLLYVSSWLDLCFKEDSLLSGC